MGGKDEESHLQLLHPLSVSPPNVDLHADGWLHMLFQWPLGSGGLVSVGCNQFGCWIIFLFLGFLALLFWPALLLPPDVDLSSQLFTQHVSSECWHPLIVLAGHQGHLVLRL